FYDSITAAFYVDMTKELSICDVGAGAGFPSIPLKIVFPQLKVTIVDSLNKRIQFLNHLADALGLQGVSFVHERAENFGNT
ncbi:class I SAM-dependent methyltransferase, partial [Klebsiella pneumoniae]|nr:class I SAM-dependent methyltransferase [Klebsiella pneumoniae]MCP6594718.1 class I SAM-dependent methyltransferase [Klebsiella pneumoniae]